MIKNDKFSKTCDFIHKNTLWYLNCQLTLVDEKVIINKDKKIAEAEENAGKVIVTIGCSIAERYISTALFDGLDM